MSTRTNAVNTLHGRLSAALDAGRPPACVADPRRLAWIEDDKEARTYAAHRCAGCPMTSACLAAAVELDAVAGVWAGRYFGSPAVRKAARLDVRP